MSCNVTGILSTAPFTVCAIDISLNIPTKTVKIRSMVMEIKEGDITQETTDAIVNSTNKDLNLSGGLVDLVKKLTCIELFN